MSLAADTFAADESLALRRDISGLRQDLCAAHQEISRLERKCDRLAKILRTLHADEQAAAMRRETMYREVL